MMEHPICSVSGLDCKLTDYLLFVRYKKLHYRKYISVLATHGIFIVFTGVVLKKKKKKKKKI